MEIVLIVLAAAALGWAAFAFNRLVRLRNQVKAGWSEMPSIDCSVPSTRAITPTVRRVSCSG